MSEKRIGTLIYDPSMGRLISGLGLNLIMEVFIAENVLM